MELAPNTRLGAYEILALVGSGGMGEVYRARDTRLDRIVALKVITGGSAVDPGTAHAVRARGAGDLVTQPPQHLRAARHRMRTAAAGAV